MGHSRVAVESAVFLMTKDTKLQLSAKVGKGGRRKEEGGREPSVFLFLFFGGAVSTRRGQGESRQQEHLRAADQSGRHRRDGGPVAIA